jgi:hypothetical protein
MTQNSPRIERQSPREPGDEATRRDDGPWDWLRRPGAWLWTAVLLGAAIRLYFVVCTQGTYDASLLEQYGAGVRKHGLIGYYHENVFMNFPPFRYSGGCQAGEEAAKEGKAASAHFGSNGF